MKIKGALVPALTFFDKDGKIDEEYQKWHLNWVLENGVNGLFVTGTYGSGYLMDNKDRVRVYEMAKEISDKHPGTFVVAHVGANDTESSVYLTEAARDLDLDAVSAVNPYTFKYRDDELVGYYSDIVKAAGSMPVFAYNNPSLTSKVIDIELVRKFASVGVCAMKDSSLNRELANAIKDFRDAEGIEFEYISGSTKDWTYFNSIGVKAMIAGACNYAPDLVASMYRLSQKSDESSAKNAADTVNHISDFIKVGNSLISSHLALTSRGYEVPFMKRPLICPYDKYADKIREDREEIDKAIEIIKTLDPEYKFVK
ncbi:MAG: dihydrodipicolinate synthase family protein [Firmicutes bacterium]|nr:dihydrodipicolinate synthase family protein [Bacillota bacterium]